MQKAFRFEVDKCTGCEACQVACSLENRIDAGIGWRRVFTFNPQKISGIESFHHSLACNHCVDPPCLRHCPANAYFKDPVTGAVTIDESRCIGCKYCSWVCPYDAPRFNPSTGIVEKCTFCAHRLEKGLNPSCVQACPTGALDFIDMTREGDPSHPETRVKGFVESGAGPAVRFASNGGPRRAPECSQSRDGRKPRDKMEFSEESGSRPDTAVRPESRVGLRSEWSLLVFTLVEAILAGAFAAPLLFSLSSQSPGALVLSKTIIAIAGVAVLILGAKHLGRPGRAWRVLFNLRRSWLSREIALFCAFLTIVFIVAAAGFTGGGVYWTGVLAGFAALFATDMLYHSTRAPGMVWHSAQVFGTGLLFAGLFSGNIILFGLMGILKALFYLRRKYNQYRRGKPSRPWLTRVRILAGLGAPLVLWWLGSPDFYPAIVCLVLAGEIIDRSEYYTELDIPSPAGQMAADLEEEAGALPPGRPLSG